MVRLKKVRQRFLRYWGGGLLVREVPGTGAGSYWSEAIQTVFPGERVLRAVLP